MGRIPVDWNGNKLESGFYETRDGKLVHIKEQEGEFRISTLGESPRPLVFLEGQYLPYTKIDPVQYLEIKEGELSRIAIFIQQNIESS